jgi:DNA repair exonuclease SbcCD ATPase subunit
MNNQTNTETVEPRIRSVEKKTGELKLYALQAEDTFGLQSIQLNLDGKSAVLIGPNEAGKTSIINALMVAIGQLKNGNPIRQGERKAEIKADFGEFEAIRIWKDKGYPRWEVKAKNGQKYGTGSDVFNGFIDSITVRPDQILSCGGAERARLVCKAVGVDMEAYHKQRDAIYQDRKSIGALKKDAESKMDGIGKPGKDVPEEEYSIRDLNDELKTLLDKQQERITIENELMSYDKKIADTNEDIAELEKKLENAKKTLADYESYKNIVIERLDKTENYDYRIEAVKEKMEKAEQINTQVRARKQYNAAKKDYEKHAEAYQAKTDEIAALDASLRDKLNNAGLVEGLQVEKEDIFLNNLRFDELSKFQQLDLAMKIGMNIKSKNSDGQFARILCMDVSQYDEENWKKVIELAKQNGFTVIIEIARRIRRDADGKLLVPDDINALNDVKKFYIEEGYAEELIEA